MPFTHGEHLDPCVAGLIENRHGTLGLRQREERPLHEVALVARGRVAGGDDEGIERASLAERHEAAA